jgi:uncharacterized protein (TIGR02001 family)
MIKKVCLFASVLTLIPLVYAEGSGKATVHAAVTSDYAGRGISQTFNEPAVQASADIAVSGIYAGAWASTIDDRTYEGGSVELDLYFGYSQAINRFRYNIGAIQYLYPGARNVATGNDYDFLEVYFAVGFSPVSIKYSEAVNDMNGLDGSKGFSYTELWLEQPFRHFDLAARIARKSFDRYDFLSHNDYLISVSRQILGATVALSYRDSDAKEEYFSVQGNYLGGPIIALTLSKNIEVSSY